MVVGATSWGVRLTNTDPVLVAAGGHQLEAHRPFQFVSEREAPTPHEDLRKQPPALVTVPKACPRSRLDAEMHTRDMQASANGDEDVSLCFASAPNKGTQGPLVQWQVGMRADCCGCGIDLPLSCSGKMRHSARSPVGLTAAPGRLLRRSDRRLETLYFLSPMEAGYMSLIYKGEMETQSRATKYIRFIIEYDRNSTQCAPNASNRGLRKQAPDGYRVRLGEHAVLASVASTWLRDTLSTPSYC